MRRLAFLATVFTTVLVIVLPFTGGGGPGLSTASAYELASFSANDRSSMPAASLPAAANATTSSIAVAAAIQGSKHASEWPASIDEVAVAATVAANAAAAAAARLVDFEHLGQKPVPKPLPPVTASGAASGTQDRRAAYQAAGQSCPGDAGGGVGGAPSAVSSGGVAGTTSDDLASFAYAYNSIRVANCLQPVPYANFYYDSCMEQRLFWMAEDPSEDPASAWGHMGSVRSDGVPSYGCDGNLAGGYGNTGATAANKWWASSGHRASLYKPSFSGSTAGVCIGFAMTHGGLPNESYDFTRAAARWTSC